jgi:hypothetical protein
LWFPEETLRSRQKGEQKHEVAEERAEPRGNLRAEELSDADNQPTREGAPNIPEAA